VADRIELKVPDLGDFQDVEVIEVLVSPGDTVAVEDGLVTLETDKAAMDVPASDAGTIVSVQVGVGDKVNSGDVVATVAPGEDGPSRSAGDGDDADATSASTAEETRPAVGTATTSATHSALGYSRRRMPERRLHSVEGLAACRQGRRRRQCHGRTRYRIR
jgi:pyruvate/2-oxoglutarate dehydrogenase complex dihydrolipoamide acyltransferase (E2) component